MAFHGAAMLPLCGLTSPLHKHRLHYYSPFSIALILINAMVCFYTLFYGYSLLLSATGVFFLLRLYACSKDGDVFNKSLKIRTNLFIGADFMTHSLFIRFYVYFNCLHFFSVVISNIETFFGLY